jgi:ribonuclease-3
MRRGPGTPAENSSPAPLEELQTLLGHTFRRPELLTLALTHRSFVYDKGIAAAGEDLADPSHDNEQLEFMGDAALGLLIAEALCTRFPGSREGELTRLRATLVSRKNLGEVGTRLQLGRWLRLGHTAEKNDGRKNAAIFANTMEALIAALYLDGGLDAARQFVQREILTHALDGLAQSVAHTGAGFSEAVGDHKSALQELLQAHAMGRPQYVLLGESGPDHKRVFTVAVRLESGNKEGSQDEAETLSEATGSTKKQAQQTAARLAVARLLERGLGTPNGSHA